MRRFLGAFPAAVVLGIVAVLGVLAYGVASSGHSETIDDALAEGRRVPAPSIDPAKARGRSAGVAGGLSRQSRRAQLLGLLVRTLPRGVAAAAALA
jgi:hypothetical protein